jgi:DNA polymerase
MEKTEMLAVLAEKVSQCQKCQELVANRTQTVFGDGNPNAKIVFCGEGPGADEDKKGIPFVGRAGKLLDNIIKACKLERSKVYILNIVKCRPPGNRNPTPEEATNCRQFLKLQLEIIRPQFIVCLGTVAAQNLLHSTHTISVLRGTWREYRGHDFIAKAICTYHPAYLLRNPAAKKDVWDDLQLLLAEMGS